MKKLTLEQLEEYLENLRDEPLWRHQANREADYYDNNQLDSETLADMALRGIAPLVRNLIGPTIDAVLGMEAKGRQDFKVIADEDGDTDFSIAMNVKMKEVERLSRADRATSEAYAAEVKVGLGWVEVSRNWNPFEYKYRSRYVHRREVYWDWLAREPDLSDARFLVRKKWYEADFLKEIFPKHKALIQNAVSEWGTWDETLFDEGDMDLTTGYHDEIRSSISDNEWRDTYRDRLCLYEVWYRIWERAFVMRLNNGSVIEFDDSSEKHLAAVSSGSVTLEEAVIPRVRLAWWVGPHQMADMASPYTHDRFPYVPFFGMREDRTGIPYGLIRRMMSPQDEVNTRLSKMMWLLSAKRVVGDSDAFDIEPSQVLDEVARPDAFIPLNPDRKHPNREPKIESDRDMSAQQFNVLKDASQAIQDTGGIYQEMLGKSDSAMSGVAIASLVEQGSNTLADINDNYRESRKMVGEMLFSLWRDDNQSNEFTVDIKKNGQSVPININKWEQDESGNRLRTNNMVTTQMRVELTTVPQTPTYRAQAQRDLMSMTEALPPEMQAIIMPMIIRGSDMAERDEVASLIEKALGMGGNQEPPTPEEQAAAEQAQAIEAQAIAEDAKSLAAKTEKELAGARKLNADTAKTMQEVEQSRGMTVSDMVRQ